MDTICNRQILLPEGTASLATGMPRTLRPHLPSVAPFHQVGGWWRSGRIAAQCVIPAALLLRALLLGMLAVTAVRMVDSAVFLYLFP